MIKSSAQVWLEYWFEELERNDEFVSVEDAGIEGFMAGSFYILDSMKAWITTLHINDPGNKNLERVLLKLDELMNNNYDEEFK